MNRHAWLAVLSVGSAAALTSLFIACGAKTVVRISPTAPAQTAGETVKIVTRALAQNTAPSELKGDCGGTITFANLAQNTQTGTTSGTASLNNFCSTDPLKNTTTVTGEVPFAITSVPDATGTGTVPSNITADAPLLTFVKKDPAGNTVENSSVGFAGFKYAAGIPGQQATAANPNVITVSELRVKSNTDTQNRSAKVENVTVNQVPQTGGGSSLTLSGRLFRAESGFTDVTTLVPIVVDAKNVPSPGGKLLFTGANNSSATMTIVSGNPVVWSTEVNGVPVSQQLSCSQLTLPTTGQ